MFPKQCFYTDHLSRPFCPFLLFMKTCPVSVSTLLLIPSVWQTLGPVNTAIQFCIVTAVSVSFILSYGMCILNIILIFDPSRSLNFWQKLRR